MLDKLSQENQIIDLPDLNRFRIGDHVVADATFDHDRHEGVVIGIELQRAHGASRLKLAPSITLLHDVDQITDGFHPNHLRKVEAPSPAPETSKIFHPGLMFPPEPPMDGNGSQWNSEPTAPAPTDQGVVPSLKEYLYQAVSDYQLLYGAGTCEPAGILAAVSHTEVQP